MEEKYPSNKLLICRDKYLQPEVKTTSGYFYVLKVTFQLLTMNYTGLSIIKECIIGQNIN